MKLGLIADTHENMPKIKNAVEIFNKNRVKLVIHCGDIISPLTYREFRKLKCPMLCVFGNNDGDKDLLKEKFKDIAEFHNTPYEFLIEKKKILVMHQPDFIESFVKSGLYDFIIYGHTHYKELKAKGKTLVINPGEAGGWLTGTSTIAILETQTSKVEFINI